MKKNLFKLTVAAAMLLGFVFSGCAGNASDDSDGGSSSAAKNLEVTSDYSQITVTWEGKPKKDSGFYIFASQENDTSKFTVDNAKDGYNVKNTSSFTVDKSGHYYVWVRNGYDGPFSDPAEVDVTLINPATNIVITPTILGFDVEWENPLENEELGGTSVAYKKTGAANWTFAGYNFAVKKYSLKKLEDGEYSIRVIVEDKYNTGVSSEELGPYTYTFDSTTYGQQPSGITSNAATAFYTVKSFPDGQDIEYYYLNCNKGDKYEFEVLDYWSYSADRVSGGYLSSIKQNSLASVEVYIYIAGACPESGNDVNSCDEGGLVVERTRFYERSNTIDFEAPKAGYYVVMVKRAGYGNSYGFSKKNQLLS